MTVPSTDKKPEIREWINIIGGLIIAGAIIYGIVVFLKPDFYDPDKGVHNLFPFIPTGITTIALVVFRIIAGGDASANMCLLLIFIGLALFMGGFFTKNETSKNAFFGAAGGFLGLGLGVPFGDYLKKREQ